MYPTLTIKPGREASAEHRHPWLFSGALAGGAKDTTHGDLVRVTDERGRVLGVGTYSAKTAIAVRLFEFGEATIDAAWFAARFQEAEARRVALGYGPGQATDGYRLVFGEADGCPGLVIDRYGEVFVLQISTAGAERLRPAILAALLQVFRPIAVIDRSDLGVRQEEGLPETKGILHGGDPGPVEFRENGWRFLADVLNGQKTGFFLDQKDLRRFLSNFASGRKGLNLFSYTGAGGIAALHGGAASVHNVDSSEAALAGCRRHAELNGFEPDRFTTEDADIFQWLSAKTETAYGLVALDPPALIKSQRDADEGRKAYHFLNRAALRLATDGALFVTSSCSRFLPEEDLAFILRRASVQAGVRLDVLGVVRQSPDHPLSVYFPESAYLKSFVCLVRR